MRSVESAAIREETSKATLFSQVLETTSGERHRQSLSLAISLVVQINRYRLVRVDSEAGRVSLE